MSNSDSESASIDSSNISDDEYEVERILNKRICYGEVEYYIKWVNYGDAHNEWVPVGNLSCQEKMDEYEKKHARNTDSVQWDPMPTKILDEKIIDGKVEYLVQFADKVDSLVPFTYGPMKKLIEKFQKQKLKRAKEDEKLRKGNAKKTRRLPKRKSDVLTDADENGNQNGNTNQLTVTDSIYINEVESIGDMRRTNGGIEYLVAYKDSNTPEWVPMHIMKRNHPQKVIHFYESCIDWE